VAYSNFSVNMAFGRHPALEAAPKFAALLGTLVVAFVLVSSLPRHLPALPHFNSLNFTAQKQTAKVVPHKARPSAPVTPVTPPQNTPAITASLPALTVTPPRVLEEYPGYAIAVDKSKKILLVLKNNSDAYEVVKVYDISLGRKVGMKQQEGDLKTPSGFYQIVEIKSGRNLPTYYGPKAFVTNYPNVFDQASGRGGGGIWIHGSKGGGRNQNSHGCVVLDNKNLMNLEAWVGKNTPVAIFPEDFSLPVVDGKVEKKYISTGFFYGDQIKPANRASGEGGGSPG